MEPQLSRRHSACDRPIRIIRSEHAIGRRLSSDSFRPWVDSRVFPQSDPLVPVAARSEDDGGDDETTDREPPPTEETEPPPRDPIIGDPPPVREEPPIIGHPPPERPPPPIVGHEPRERVHVPPEEMPRIERTGGAQPPEDRIHVDPDDMPRIEDEIPRAPEELAPDRLDPQRIESRLPGPGDTLMRPAVDDPLESKRRRGDEPPQISDDELRAVPRPSANSYPRRIAHEEHIEYRYDPETGNVDGRIVQSTEPVVTGWDASPPLQEERAVGTWDVTPSLEGVEVTGGQRVAVPADIKSALSEQSEQTGEPVTETVALRFAHDLDTGSTRSTYKTPTVARSPATYESPDGSLSSIFTSERDPFDSPAALDHPDADETAGDSPAAGLSHPNADADTGSSPATYKASPDEMVQALHARNAAKGRGTLNPEYADLLKVLQQQEKDRKAVQKQKASNRRKSKAKDDLLTGYSLPQIVIVQERINPRLGRM